MADAAEIKTYCRIRPELPVEEGNPGHKIIASQISQTSVVVNPQRKGDQASSYSFNRVFGISSTQEDIFNHTAKPVLDDALRGYNGTVFAYGQTAAGKTYTMLGPSFFCEPRLSGIIPRSIRYLFGQLSLSKSSFTVKISFIEIYLEVVRDLLTGDVKPLSIYEDSTGAVTIPEMAEVVVVNSDDALKLAGAASALRATTAHKMNRVSSRSHALLRLHISRETSGVALTSVVYLVDLAGSEKVSKTEAEGMRLTEAKKINQSLLALGNCVNILTEVQPQPRGNVSAFLTPSHGGLDGTNTFNADDGTNQVQKDTNVFSKKNFNATATRSFVPYRNSKLTRILQESLGGNAKTAIIINISPSSLNRSETLSSLYFATRAKNVKNRPHVNMQASNQLMQQKIEAMMRKIENNQKTIISLKRQIEERSGTTCDIDINDAFEGVHGLGGLDKFEHTEREQGDDNNTNTRSDEGEEGKSPGERHIQTSTEDSNGGEVSDGGDTGGSSVLDVTLRKQRNTRRKISMRDYDLHNYEINKNRIAFTALKQKNAAIKAKIEEEQAFSIFRTSQYNSVKSNAFNYQSEIYNDEDIMNHFIMYTSAILNIPVPNMNTRDLQELSYKDRVPQYSDSYNQQSNNQTSNTYNPDVPSVVQPHRLLVASRPSSSQAERSTRGQSMINQRQHEGKASSHSYPTYDQELNSAVFPEMLSNAYLSCALNLPGKLKKIVKMNILTPSMLNGAAHMCMWHSSESCLKVLSKVGADVNVIMNPLELNFLNHQNEGIGPITQLGKLGPFEEKSSTAFSYSPLHVAASVGNESQVKLLNIIFNNNRLKKNQQDSNGNTALDIALKLKDEGLKVGKILFANECLLSDVCSHPNVKSHNKRQRKPQGGFDSQVSSALVDIDVDVDEENRESSGFSVRVLGCEFNDPTMKYPLTELLILEYACQHNIVDWMKHILSNISPDGFSLLVQKVKILEHDEELKKDERYKEVMGTDYFKPGDLQEVWKRCLTKTELPPNISLLLREYHRSPLSKLVEVACDNELLLGQLLVELKRIFSTRTTNISGLSIQPFLSLGLLHSIKYDLKASFNLLLKSGALPFINDGLSGYPLCCVAAVVASDYLTELIDYSARIFPGCLSLFLLSMGVVMEYNLTHLIATNMKIKGEVSNTILNAFEAAIPRSILTLWLTSDASGLELAGVAPAWSDGCVGLIRIAEQIAEWRNDTPNTCPNNSDSNNMMIENGSVGQVTIQGKSTNILGINTEVIPLSQVILGTYTKPTCQTNGKNDEMKKKLNKRLNKLECIASTFTHSAANIAMNPLSISRDSKL